MVLIHVRGNGSNGGHHGIVIWWDDTSIIGGGSSHWHSGERKRSGKTLESSKQSSWPSLGVGYQVSRCSATLGNKIWDYWRDR